MAVAVVASNRVRVIATAVLCVIGFGVFAVAVHQQQLHLAQRLQTVQKTIATHKQLHNSECLECHQQQQQQHQFQKQKQQLPAIDAINCKYSNHTTIHNRLSNDSIADENNFQGSFATTRIEMESPVVCFNERPYVLTYFGLDEGRTEFLENLPYALPHIVLVSLNLKQSVVKPIFIPTSMGSLPNLIFWMGEGAYFGTLPSQIGKLSQLIFLSFVDNKLEGSLPTELGSMRHCQNLILQSNNFTGTLPSQFGMLQALAKFEIQSASIEGNIPSQLGNMSKLQTVHISDLPYLTGTLPSQLGLLAQLISLTIDWTSVHGQVPSELGQLTLLEYLYLNHNNLVGTLPTHMFLLTRLGHLDVSDNQFQGTLPSLISNFRLITWIGFANNLFSGVLPSQLATLTHLTALNISLNKFTDGISHVISLPQLQLLDLSYNSFSGFLPSNLTPFITPTNQSRASTPTNTNTTTSLLILCSFSGFSNIQCPQLPPPQTLTPSAVIALCTASLFIATVLIALFVFVVWYRKHVVIRQSGAIFATTTLCSLLMIVAVVPLLGIAGLPNVSKASRTALCRGTFAMLSYGHVVSASCVFARNYLLHMIFNNPKLKLIKVSPVSHLLPRIATSTLCNSLLIAPVLFFTTSSSAWCSYPTHAPASLAVLVLNVIAFFGLCVGSLVMSFKIRDIPVQYNETPHLTNSMYNMMAFGLVTLLVTAFIHINTLQYIAFSLSILVTVVSFVISLYTPKLKIVFSPTNTQSHQQQQQQKNAKRNTNTIRNNSNNNTRTKFKNTTTNTNTNTNTTTNSSSNSSNCVSHAVAGSREIPLSQI